MDSDYNFDNLAVTTFRSNLDVEHSLTAAATYSWSKIQFSAGLNYHSGIPYTTPLTNTAIDTTGATPLIEFNEPNNETLESYFRTDISAKYSFEIDETFSGNLNISLLNIFDQQTRLASYYQIGTDENNEASINRVDQYSLGFTPNISFQLFF